MQRPLKAYLKHGRLADVLALLQVLALDKSAHRSEAGLQEELQGVPASADGQLIEFLLDFIRGWIGAARVGYDLGGPRLEPGNFGNQVGAFHVEANLLGVYYSVADKNGEKFPPKMPGR